MRQERGWSQQEAHEHLHEGLGLAPKSRASYVSLEAGRAPDPAQQKFLVSYFGKGPEDEPEAAPPPDLSTVVAAIDRLTAAVERGRAERVAWEVELVKSLGQLLRGEAPSGDLADGPRADVLR